MILVGGEPHEVLRDLGDTLELRVPERSHRLRGGDHLHVPAGNTINIPKCDLVLEDMYAENFVPEGGPNR